MAHKTLYDIYVIVCAAHLLTAVARNQHLICKSVNDLFPETSDEPGRNRSTVEHRGAIQGRPGKLGPVGPRGLPGPQGIKGEAGFVDYNNISAIVERKVCEGLTGIVADLNELRKDVGDLRLILQDRLNCMASDLLYNGTCYSMPYLSAFRDLRYARATQICGEVGQQMAEIRDKTHQIVLQSVMRLKMPHFTTDFCLWIGMSYDNARKILRYRSGKEVPHSEFRWWPGYPTGGRKRMAVGVLHNSKSEGVYDVDNNASLNGVLCEKKI